MKVLLASFFALLALLPHKGFSIDALQFECSLSIEAHPLEYTLITRSAAVRLRFASNCLRLRDFTFEAFFTFRRRLSRSRHPTKVNLRLFGNSYSLIFGKRSERNRRSVLRKLVYSEMTLLPSGRQAASKIQVDRDNRLLLEERVANSFNYDNLRHLLTMRNPIRCVVGDNLTEMDCILGK